MATYYNGKRRPASHKSRSHQPVDVRPANEQERIIYPRVAQAVARWLGQQPDAPDRGLVRVEIKDSTND